MVTVQDDVSEHETDVSLIDGRLLNLETDVSLLTENVINVESEVFDNQEAIFRKDNQYLTMYNFSTAHRLRISYYKRFL